MIYFRELCCILMEMFTDVCVWLWRNVWQRTRNFSVKHTREGVKQSFVICFSSGYQTCPIFTGSWSHELHVFTEEEGGSNNQLRTEVEWCKVKSDFALLDLMVLVIYGYVRQVGVLCIGPLHREDITKLDGMVHQGGICGVKAQGRRSEEGGWINHPFTTYI